jgi:hypothetical protein
MESVAKAGSTNRAVLVSGDNQPIFADGFFFNNPEHLSQQTNGAIHQLSLQNALTGQADIRCAFAIRGEVAISPIAAPFGSIECRETISPVALGEFVDSLLQKVRLMGCERLRLVNYPHCYAPRHMHRLVYTLAEQGFNIIKNTPTFYLPVHNDSLTKRMHAQERQRLRKSQRAGLNPSRWENPCIPTVVAFIRQSRHQQGYPLTISMDCLSRLLHQFPEQFPVFVVCDGETIAALCVCVRVRHDILYSFLPANQADYQSFSPMVMLIDYLYQYSQHTGVDLLDLGASLDAQQQHKPSLAQFKQNMGAITCPKLTFEIEL